jgi:integrase
MSQRKRRGAGEGSIAQRPDGRWSGTVSLGWENGKRKRASVYGSTQGEAIDKLRALRSGVAGGVTLIDGRTTTGAYLASWLEGKLDLRPSTRLRYQGCIRDQLAPHLGRIPVAKLSKEHVTQMLVALSKGGSAPRTVAHARGILRGALNDLIRDGKLTRNAAKDARTFPVPKRAHISRSPDEVRTVLEAVRGDKIENLVCLALFSGCREGELLGLRWANVDIEGRQITINQSLSRISRQTRLSETKTTESRRTVRLPGPAGAALQAERRRQLEARLAAGPRWRQPIADLVFTTETGAPLIGGSVTMRLGRLLAKAGLPHLRFHDLRHIFAAATLASGVDIVTLSRALGHAKVSTTADIYTDVVPSLREDAADKLERLWGAI